MLKTIHAFETKQKQAFPGGPVVKNSPCNAGGIGLITGPGKMPHATGQLACASQLLSPYSRVRELQLLSLYPATAEAC